MTSSAKYGVDETGESGLFVFARFHALNAIGALHDEDVWPDWRYLCSDKMPIFFTRVVAGVKNPQACDVNKKHASTQDMTGVIGCESNSGTWCD